MTADVATLREVADPNPPDPLVIEEVEWLLARAKSGELRGFAWAAVFPDRDTRCDWTLGSYSAEMMATISDLQFRYALMRYECTVGQGQSVEEPA